jgi:hypothetical protein
VEGDARHQNEQGQDRFFTHFSSHERSLGQVENEGSSCLSILPWRFPEEIDEEKMELLTSHSSSDAHHSGSIAASQSPSRLMTAKENAGLLQAMRPSVLEQRFRSQLLSV